MMNEWWFLVVTGVFITVVGFILMKPLRCRFMGQFLGIIGISCLSAFGYWAWGDYFSWNGFLKQQYAREEAQRVMKTTNGPQEIIHKIEQRLAQEPDSAQGWFLLGRLYSHQNQMNQALEAFAKAHQLEPLNEQYSVHYAHGLWVNNKEEFNTPIRKIFKDLLEHNPKQPDALAMLAMDSYLRHDYERAVGYWNQLLQLAPPQSDEAKAIRQAIAKAQRESGL